MEERIGFGLRILKSATQVLVLILIVVEERIGFSQESPFAVYTPCLNPYCSGRKNRIICFFLFKSWRIDSKVLILIVVEERIGYNYWIYDKFRGFRVLILIVVEERIGSLETLTPAKFRSAS